LGKMDLETRKRVKPHVTKEDIKRGLRNLGLKRGDVVVVHSSLSSFGYVEGGADAVIDALIETVGNEGTVVMPTFHDGKLYRPPKDPVTTPSRLGRITEVFCHRKGVVRGVDCNMAAIGPKAHEIVNYSPVPPGRPRNNWFYKIAELDGYVLLLGVGQNRNSTLHTAQALAIEEVEGVQIDIYELPDYEFLPFTNEIWDPPLLEHGYMKIGRIGEAEIRLIKSRGLYEIAKKLYLESRELRRRTEKYLERRRRFRQELISSVQGLSEADIEAWKKVEAQRKSVQKLRWMLINASEKIGPGDRRALAELIEDGDLRLFADQLEGRLMMDFENTIKILRSEKFMSIISKYVFP